MFYLNNTEYIFYSKQQSLTWKISDLITQVWLFTSEKYAKLLINSTIVWPVSLNVNFYGLMQQLNFGTMVWTLRDSLCVQSYSGFKLSIPVLPSPLWEISA